MIDGQDLARVFRLLPGVEARIEHLTIQRGRSERGGGVLVEATARATLHAVVVNDNHSTGDGGGVAVDPDARLTLAYSTLSHNVADGGGGGLASDGFAAIEHSTFGWNAAGGNGDGSGAGGTEGIGVTHGGAIFVGTGGGVTMLHATLSDNRATLGGALASSGAVEMKSSIITNSFDVENCDGPIDSLGSNLSSDSSCDLTGPGDLQDVDPGLGPLHVYGDWETGTYPPLEDSPVIDAAEACPEHDQLFEERTFCSMGATDYHPEYFYVPGGLVYVGDHPRDRNVPGDPVSILGAPTNQAGGYLTIPDILTIEARSNAKELYLLQAVNHTTPVTQDGLVVYDATQNSAVGIFSGTDLRDIALKPGGTEVLVTDATSDELRIFSTASRQQTGSIPIPSDPNGVAVHPHGYTAYVTQLSGRVEVVRIDLKTVIGHFDSGPQPVDVAFHPGGHRAYVLNHYGVSVTVVDGSHQVIDTIDLGAPLMNPYDYYGSIAVNPNGDFVYVADGQGGVVNVIGVPTNNILSSQTLYGSPCGVGILP